ncbi:MAG: hypothetical protein CMJ18_28065 [Phycisphaeraceae bacterium]|nr:hypothetical protein [Phycisphaeraceae bacterium]
MRDVLIERFFTALISGDRQASRAVVDEALDAGHGAGEILVRLFWPTNEHIQDLYRGDQLSDLAHNFSTRLMRTLAEQMQLRLEQHPRMGKRLLMVCGNDQGEELGAQISADLLEAAGYEIYFAGGGIANDEIVSQVGQLRPQVLVIFGAVAPTVPVTRLLIDRLHDIGVCPELQTVVGGGIFNRADGLAEEIGADLWATDPEELVQVLIEHPDRRMTQDQRTVGRKRRTKRPAA